MACRSVPAGLGRLAQNSLIAAGVPLWSVYQPPLPHNGIASQSPLVKVEVVYRTLDTATWDDPWFADLEPDAKLFFIYLITNRRTNACGVYEVTERQMAFETNLAGDRIHTLLIGLAPRIQWYPAEQIVWVRNFYRHNCHSPKMTTSAIGHLSRMPAHIRRDVAEIYPELGSDEDRVSIGYAKGMDTDTQVKEKEKEEAKGKAKAKGKGARAEYPPEFESFWTLVVRKEPSKAKTYEAWEKAVAREADPLEIIAGAERWAPVWEAVARDDMTKVAHATTWLNQDRWTVENPAMPRASPNGRVASPQAMFDLAQRYEEAGV
jgi:hypothetical protein